MNPLRFRLLRRKRNTKFLPLLPALLGAAALLCPTRAPAAAPTPMKAIDEFLNANDKCNQALDDKQSIYAKDHKTLKSTYDMEVQCPKNTGDEVVSYNAQVVEKTTDLAKLRRPFAQSLQPLHDLGACRLAYSGMKDVFDNFVSMREEYCKELGTLLQRVKDCGAGPEDKDCAEDWNHLRKAQTDYVKEIGARAADADLFLKALEEVTHRAAKAYRADFDRLDPLFGARAPANAKKPTDSIPDAPDLKPGNGNKDSFANNSLQTYYGLLRTPASVSTITADKIPAVPADLIAEEDVASARVHHFRSGLADTLAKYKVKANALRGYVADTIDKQGDPTKNTSFTKKLVSYAPTVTGFADPASKLLNNSSNSSPASTGGGDSHAALGEVAAAAGLGALAAKGLSSATGDTGSSQEPPATAPNTGKGEGPAAGVTNDPAAPESHGGGGKADASPTAPTAPVAKTEANPPESPATFSYGGSGAQGGSSRMLAGKYAGPATAAAPATGVVQGGAAGPELGSSFSSNLEPRSAPRSTSQSVGGEVANLLGQMKNLFNFDEAPTPGGNLGGAPMPGGGPPDAPGGGPAPLLGGGDMPGGGPDAAAPEAAASADGGSEPSVAGVAQLDPVRGSPFGRLDTTLFARVRARHHRCMERGQILYGLKERVE